MPIRDFRRLDRKVECAKCGRKLPYYELENGFCLPCRKSEEEIAKKGGQLQAQITKKYASPKEHRKKEDRMLREKVSQRNMSEAMPCPFCGKISTLSYFARYVREPGIAPYIVDGYVCSYWRCKAVGKTLSDMHQNTGLFVRMVNKIVPLKQAISH